MERKETMTTPLMPESFALNGAVISADEKLSWLSSMRSALDTEQMETRGSMIPDDQFISILNGYLNSAEDAFVVYEAQKVFVGFMKWKNVEEGICLINRVFETEECIEMVTHYLEICRDLLSKQNPHCCSFLGRIRTSVKHVVQTYTDGGYGPGTDNFLHQLIGVFFKIAKLAGKFKSKDNIGALTEIYLTKDSLCFHILFHPDVKSFIKRKLCLTLYFIVKPTSDLHNLCTTELNISPTVQCFDQALLQLTKTIVRKILDIDFKAVLLKFGQTDTFTGSQSYSKGSNNVMDYAHLREWCILSLAMVLLLQKAQTDLNSNLCTEFVTKMDSCVKEGLEVRSSILFSWLPTVFADQDDMWIEALMILLDLQPRLSITCHVINHHWYFLQFVNTLAYDHLVLIDLLTSPETCFHDYLTQYLTFLLGTWTDFTATVVNFEHSLRDTEDIISVKVMERKNTSEPLCAVYDNQVDFMEKLELNSGIKQSTEVSDNEAVAMDIEDTADPPSDLHKFENTVTHQSSCMPHEGSLKRTSNQNIEISQKNLAIEVKTTAGLAMLMGTYNDSEDDIEDDVEEVNKLEVEVGKLEVEDVINLEVEEVSELAKEEENKLEVTVSKLEVEDVSKLEVNCSEVALPEAKCDSFQHFSGAHLHKVPETIHMDEDMLDERNIDYNGDDSANNTDSEGCESDTEDISVMDRTMGMLIRVMLKLQRLWKHQIISYDPGTLLKLLEEVEVLYAIAEI